MIISTYDPEHLHPSFGIDLGDVDLGPVEAFGVGAAFARVPPAGTPTRTSTTRPRRS